MNLKEKRKVVSDFIIKVTHSNKNYSTEFGGSTPEKDLCELSEKANKIKEILEDGEPFGCRTESVAKLMSVLLDEKITVKQSNINYDDYEDENVEYRHIKGMAPVVYSAIFDGEEIRIIDSVGDDCYYEFSEMVEFFERYATDEEIVKAVNSFDKKTIDLIFSFLFI